MATKYADFDLASGNNDGSSWTHAWRTMADAIAGTNSAPPAAGDTVYCRGTDTLAATPTYNLDGAWNAWIKFIGVNASGTNDGTRATLDANGGNFAPLSLDSATYTLFENFRFTGSGNTDGVDTPGAASSVIMFNNCSFDNNAARGCDCYYSAAGGTGFLFFRCTFYNNVTAMSCWSSNVFILCSFHDCSSYAFDGAALGTVIGCIVYDIGSKGIYQNSTCFVMNSVFDNCVKGWEVYDGANLSWCLMNRFTNNSTNGIDGNNSLLYMFANAFDGNVDHILDGSVFLTINNNGTNLQVELNENGAGGGDTNQGYVSTTEGSEDYSTNYVSGTDPHIRRTAITIPTS